MDHTPHLRKKLARKHQNFALLYSKFTLPLSKFLIKRMGGDQQAVEEVFSRTVVAAWQGYHSFEHKSSYFTWLCRIALNKMADYYREQIHERSRLIYPTLRVWANLEDKNLTPEEKVVLDELRRNVNQCLDLLPPEKRQLLYLRFWQDMTLKEIARILGVSERAAEGKLYRAKLALKHALISNYPNF